MDRVAVDVGGTGSLGGISPRRDPDSGEVPLARVRVSRIVVARPGDQARYRELYRRNQPARDSQEMARVAEWLGQRFEAIVFLTATIDEELDRDDRKGVSNRSGRRESPPEEIGRSLFEVVPTDGRKEGPSS